MSDVYDLSEPVEPLDCEGLYIHDDGDGVEIVTHHGSPDFEKWKIHYWDRDALRALAAMCLRVAERP